MVEFDTSRGQLPLFAQPKSEGPARRNNPARRNLRVEAAQWIDAHPFAMKQLLRFARELAGRSRRFGVGLLAERLRWEGAVEGWPPEEFKVNNNHRAYIARWMIAQDPSLERWLKFREVRW